MLRSPCTCAALLTAALVLLTNSARAQTVDEIVTRHLQAKGGVKKLKAINSVKLTGKMSAQGVELPTTVWTKRPNLMRRDSDLQGQKIVLAFDGTTVWMINPMIGAQPQEIKGPPAEQTREAADFDSVFIDYKQKGHTIELVGAETIGETKVYHLKVTRKSGLVHHYYLDADKALEVKMATTMEQGGVKAEVGTEFSNFQQVEGLMVPFSTRQTMNGTPIAEFKVDKIEFNVPMDDALFKMPK